MNGRTIVAHLMAAPLLMAAAPEPAPTAVPEPVRLKPSSQWVLDYADNACQLIRTFGEGERKTVLLIQGPAPDRMLMLIVGKPLATSQTGVPARFRPGGSGAKGSPTISKNGTPGVLWNYVPLWRESAPGDKITVKVQLPGVRPEPTDVVERAAERAHRHAFASAMTELEIDAGSGRTVILETGALGDQLTAFDECGRDALRDWGLDPDIQDKVVRPVWTPNPGQWLSVKDYPTDMVRLGIEGEVRARLIVDATGKVTSCTGLSHFAAPQFNKVVCDIFKKRARLEPAELADGTKVPSYYTAQIRFSLP
ncbi:MAG: energy transducer TonB [Pseudomonadota bacterium]|nr:energy transducer TonB [Pseudomonadota bacterium]